MRFNMQRRVAEDQHKHLQYKISFAIIYATKLQMSILLINLPKFIYSVDKFTHESPLISNQFTNKSCPFPT